MQTRLVVFATSLVDIFHTLQMEQRIKQVLAHVQDRQFAGVAVPDGDGPFTQGPVGIFPVVCLSFLILGFGTVPSVR